MDIRMERGRVAGSVGVTVLIVLALGLCGLCAFQWVRETKLRVRVDELQAERQKLNDEKASVEAQGRRFQEEIQRVERERAELFKTTQTNNEALVKARAELAKASLEGERFRKTADAYKEGFDKANESIRQQNEGLLKMKADITKVLAERMVPITQPLPEVDAPPPNAKKGWETQVGLSVKCLNGEDAGLEARYSATSLGGKRAVQALAVAIAGQVEADSTKPVPVVALKADHYIHKQYGKVFTPVLEVVKWIGMDGEAPAAPVAAEPEAAPAPAGRRRRNV
jgi:hypothetical protein